VPVPAVTYAFAALGTRYEGDQLRNEVAVIDADEASANANNLVTGSTWDPRVKRAIHGKSPSHLTRHEPTSR